MSSVAPSTAVVAPKRFTTSLMVIFMVRCRGPGRTQGFEGGPPRVPLETSVRLLPDRLDVRAEAGLEGLGALGGHGLVVDVGDLAVEVRAHAARELHRQLGRRAGRALDLVLRRDREE